MTKDLEVLQIKVLARIYQRLYKALGFFCLIKPLTWFKIRFSRFNFILFLGYQTTCEVNYECKKNSCCRRRGVYWIADQ